MSVNLKEKLANFVVWKHFAYRKQGYFLMLCVCGPVCHTSGQKTFFCDSLPTFLIFSATIFVTHSSLSQDPRRHNITNFSVLRLQGGNWVMKIAAEKIELTFSIFSAAIFVTPTPSQSSQNLQICDIESSSNIFENLPIGIAGPSNSQYCVFVEIVLRI